MKEDAKRTVKLDPETTHKLQTAIKLLNEVMSSINTSNQGNNTEEGTIKSILEGDVTLRKKFKPKK